MTDTARRDLPDGRWVEYTETPRRSYKLFHDDTEKPKTLVSVTTVLGVLNKSALLRWAEAQGAAGALAAVRMGELNPAIHHNDEAIGVVRTLNLGADAAKKDAADRGLTIHDALQSYCFDGNLPSPMDMAMEARPYMRGLAKALIALDPRPIHVERIVVHPELGYAGRADLIAEIKGSRTLLDLKTSKSGRGYPEAHIQARGYDAADTAVGDPSADQILVLGVSPNGEFCVDDCTAPPDAFERVLNVYRLMGDVRRPLDASARVAAKAAKETA